jgi:hypothetical protein
MRRLALLVSTVLSATGLSFMAMAVPAMASSTPPPRPPMVFAPTLACHLTAPQCNEPVYAQSPVSSLDLVPNADAAMTKSGLNLVASANNQLNNGNQDFDAQLADFVLPGGEYNYSAFDILHYGGRPVYFEEWAPAGFDSGFCLQVQPLTRHVVLRACDGGADQAFIITTSAPFLFNAPAPYTYALSALRTFNAQHHLCLTGPASLTGPITVSRCVRVTPGVGSGQYWSAIP